MEITYPLLPPKAGYVEVIDENGEHVYQPTPETAERLKKDLEFTQTTDNLQSTINSLLDVSETDDQSAALEFRKAVQLFVASIDDESTSMQIASVYPTYHVGVSYQIGDIFRYGVNSVGDSQLYQVLQAHTSAAEWTPDSATSLYKKIGIAEDGTPLWVQPLGATDAYNIGDQVMYNGKKYESVINANVWAPDVYPAGWKEVSDTSTSEPDPEPSTPDEPETETVPDFVQPTGAHDAYGIGDQVMYNGKKYESTIDNNVWSPDAYPAGWKLIE